MLALRKRGKVYHVRGTIRVGKESRQIGEHSTGCCERQAAEAYRAKLEHDIRAEILHGPAGRHASLTIADVLLSYVERPGLGLKEVWYAGQLGDVIGDDRVRDITTAWQRFLSERCQDLAPSTVNRFRSVLVAALNHAGISAGRDLKALPVRNVRVVYLSLPEQEALLAAYSEQSRPIALLMCYSGARTQEALQLQWQNVDLARGEMFLPRTKSGRPRTVALHQRVQNALRELSQARGEPTFGHVFLSSRGRPYSDTRTGGAHQGGNPLKRAHANACRRAGIDPHWFTVHGWRHHWASRCVMAGVDLPTLQRLGGWASLRMVERYAAVAPDHLHEAIRKLA